MYEGVKFYGPYTRKDGRKHLVYRRDDGTLTSLSYPKYLLEMELGRYLKDNETVDHIDRDFTNDSVQNLRVVKRGFHASDDVIRNKDQSFDCPWCGDEFVIIGSKLNDTKHNRIKGKTGPFCSKTCAGQYGAFVQNGGKKFMVKPIPEITKYQKSKCV